MNTFLPYKSFAVSAATLDYRRLGKQRVEVLQILNALTGNSKGWVNHPCTRMWAGHEWALAMYGQYVCHEWVRRGYKDTCSDKIHAVMVQNGIEIPKDRSSMPSWLGDADFHRSHRSNLLRKDPDFYRPLFGSDLPDDLPYIWPCG